MRENMTNKEEIKKSIVYKFGWPFALLIIFVIVVTETIPVILGAGYMARWDWGFLYTTMHFVLLPITCLAHASLNFNRVIRSKREYQEIIQFASVVVSLGYLLLLYLHP
jgi:hypothetical protein